MGAIANDWLPAVQAEFGKPYYRELYKFVTREYANGIVYPPAQDIFNALHLTPLSKVKAVILGQDPYHGDHQAHGLCFSVQPGTQIPPSLVNIYKELHDDIGCRIPDNGCLTSWAEQGVLLLNTVLTVRAHQANSHRNHGWEQSPMLTNPGHLILRAPHPSPLSAYRGFFGCRHFSQCNQFLRDHGVDPIDWQIRNIYN